MEEAKIYKKALELATYHAAEYWIEKAKEELMEEGNLTENQKIQLAQRISGMQKALNCKLTHLRYDNSSSTNKFIKLYTKDFSTGMLSAKVIIYGTLVSFADDVFTCGKTYEIEKLLGYEVL